MVMFAVNSLADVPAGQPGDISRGSHLIVEPARFGEEVDVVPGRAVCYNDEGKLEYFMGEEEQTVIGVTVRTYPAGSGYPESINIPKGTLVGVMRRGWCLVRCAHGTPTQGGDVYMFTTDDAASSNAKAGEFSAVEVATKTVRLPGATWGSSGVSKEKIAEVAVI